MHVSIRIPDKNISYLEKRGLNSFQIKKVYEAYCNYALHFVTGNKVAEAFFEQWFDTNKETDVIKNIIK